MATFKRPLVVLQPGKNKHGYSWVKYCKQRVQKNDSLNIAVTGTPGTGKSWAIIGFAKQYDPDWNLDNCFFSASKFVRAMKDGKFKRGSFVMYDEASIDLNSMAWQNELNRSMNLIFSTMRHRNLILCLSFPYLSFLAKPVRKLMTAHFQAQGYNRESESIIRPKVLQYNDSLDKFYTPRLIVKEKGKFLQYCDSIKIPKADQELLDEYERRKREFTDQLFESCASKLESLEKKQIKKSLTDRQELILQRIKDGLTLREIAEEEGTSIRNVRGIVGSIKKNPKIVMNKVDNRYLVEDNRNNSKTDTELPTKAPTT